MKLKFFIIISTVSIIVPICLIISEHKSNAKPASNKQDLKCTVQTYDCTNYVHNLNHPAYQDKDKCRFVNEICTSSGKHLEGYEPPMFKQRYTLAKNGVCVPAGCCCCKPHRRDSTA